MNGSTLQLIGSSVAQMGADLLVQQFRAAPGPQAPPSQPPVLFADGTLVDDATTAAMGQLKTLGITENAAIKAIVREEADRRIHEKLNEVHAVAWSNAQRQASSSSSSGLIWAILGIMGGVAVTALTAASERPRRGR